ncbi:carboxymethylenebutenolidase [Virgisporangium aliadipatigenens]|uniref:Carboxymethylenebutenolidase n=1 Tax=Virgisporangium aliadipatigenens TaxID=741659 RepID=A0A8J3YUT3_9ACTN|nr:dienelactone hydrolase family protein [Virgisporangium aliadipatigenens]GIJ51931.1 carboxymethylenebutenolidase [Virgisporangium aliadipatigenens]
MHIQRYLAEEVVEDYADGIIPRREALRRLGLLGVAAAVAAPMLAACDSADGEPPTPAAPSATPSGSAPAGPQPVATQPITYTGAQGRTLMGAWAPAADPKGAVLVIHENRGLTDHIRSVAGRLAASGFSAIAVDLLSAEGGTATFTDPAQATAALNAAPPGRFVDDMRSTVDELGKRAPGRKVGAVGFCFGGGMVWQFLAAGEARLAAAAPFYGPTPDSPDFAGSRNAAVLAFYAEKDSRVNATRETARAALTKAGLTHEIVTVPGADHAFFNDTGARYNAQAATDAYTRLVTWYGKHLG